MFMTSAPRRFPASSNDDAALFLDLAGNVHRLIRHIQQIFDLRPVEPLDAEQMPVRER
jgi:hypothetical protein